MERAMKFIRRWPTTIIYLVMILTTQLILIALEVTNHG